MLMMMAIATLLQALSTAADAAGYAGQETSAAWRAEALQRIEQIRTAPLTVRVSDAAGRPIAGAAVQLHQRRHAFAFGTAVAMKQLLGTGADDRQYRQTLQRYFNSAVFENDMKWPHNYPQLDPQVDEALNWLLEREFRVRGHNLIWPSWRWLPEPLRDLKDDPSELRRQTHHRVSEVVSHYRGRVAQWDVVNEPYSQDDLLKILGRDVMLEWFRLARCGDPATELYLNDYGILEGPAENPHREHFAQTIRWLIDQGAPIGGIGIQSHFDAGSLPPPAQLLAVLDQFAAFGLPIESTEVSFNLEDQQLQAQYMRDYLIALFSHPSVTGITLWGFWEGRHWRPQAALFERDWKLRPAGQAWIELVHRQWMTRVQQHTDASGTMQARGFLGRYDVSVTVGRRTEKTSVELGREGARLDITFDSPH